MEEITIKVPAPFAGVQDLGFTARYPGQDPFGPARDVPLLIEGPPAPMRRLVDRLRLLRAGGEGAHEWSDPILLGEEVAVIAFRDRSLEGTQGPAGPAFVGHVLNLVRPVCFAFLQDCARRAGLKLSDPIEIQVQGRRRIAELELRLDQIVQPNGEVLLWSPGGGR